jgi:hypothetical protein
MIDNVKDIRERLAGFLTIEVINPKGGSISHSTAGEIELD